MDSAAKTARFLELAISAVADYQRQKDSPGAEQAAPPELPESLVEKQLWFDFLDEPAEILRLKWIESQKAGRDIGFKQAFQLWLKHRPRWRAAQPRCRRTAVQSAGRAGSAKLGYVPRFCNRHISRLLLEGVPLACEIGRVDAKAPPWEAIDVRVLLSVQRQGEG